MSIPEIIAEIRAEIDEGFEKGGKIGIALVFLPQIAGAIIAAVIAEVFSMPGYSFLFLLVLLGFLGGFVKSLVFDRQAVFVSVVKNVLIVALIALVFAIGMLIVSII